MVHFSAGVFILGDSLWLQFARKVGDVGPGVVDLALDISDGGIASSSSSSASIVGSDSDISEGVLIGGIRFHDASFGSYTRLRISCDYIGHKNCQKYRNTGAKQQRTLGKYEPYAYLAIWYHHKHFYANRAAHLKYTAVALEAQQSWIEDHRAELAAQLPN